MMIEAAVSPATTAKRRQFIGLPYGDPVMLGAAMILRRSVSVFATFVLVAGLGVACNLSVPMSPPTGSASPAAQFSAPAAAACAPVELRLPSGARVNLTGTWQGAGRATFVRQLGSCVSWFALSNSPNRELGSDEMITFHGQVAADFTLSGEWTWILRHPNAPGPFGDSVTFEIDSAIVDGEETLVLRSTTTVPPSDGGGPYGAATLEYAGPLPQFQGE
jgi:hypothetical protein